MLFILIFGQTKLYSQVNGVKLNMSYISIFHLQYTINPNYWMMKENHEYSFGIVYQKRKSNYIIKFKNFNANIDCYGLKFGYINNVKGRGIKVRFETNLSFVTYKSELTEPVSIKLRDVYTALIQFGPNIKFPISPSVEFDLVFQLVSGYGFYGSGNTIPANQFGYKLNLDLYPSFDITYHFKK